MHPPDKKLNYSLLNDVALDLLPLPQKQSWHENEQKFICSTGTVCSQHCFRGRGGRTFVFQKTVFKGLQVPEVHPS